MGTATRCPRHDIIITAITHSFVSNPTATDGLEISLELGDFLCAQTVRFVPFWPRMISKPYTDNGRVHFSLGQEVTLPDRTFMHPVQAENISKFRQTLLRYYHLLGVS